MFRQLRRSKQALSTDECENILINGSSGVLALSGDNDYPYALPISYWFDKQNDRIIFHCAKSGHKIDAIARNNKASFCVIAQDIIVPEQFVTNYKSVIAFGTINILQDKKDKCDTVIALTKKYCPNLSQERVNTEVDDFYTTLCMLELKIEHLSGKRANVQ